MDKDFRNYRMVCTLTFGDIYGQIIVWLIVIFLTALIVKSPANPKASIIEIFSLGIVNVPGFLTSPKIVTLKFCICIDITGFCK